MPVIMESNTEVVEVYSRVSNQHIMGFSGPIDLNILSVKTVMDLLGIKNQKYVFERVHYIYKLMLSKFYREQKSKERLRQ